MRRRLAAPDPGPREISGVLAATSPRGHSGTKLPPGKASVGRDELLAERCHCGADVAPRIQPYPEAGIEQLTYRCMSCTCAWQRTVPAGDDPETAAMQERADDPGPHPGQTVRIPPGGPVRIHVDAREAGAIVGKAWAALEPTLELSPAVARALWSALEDHFTGEVGP